MGGAARAKWHVRRDAAAERLKYVYDDGDPLAIECPQSGLLCVECAYVWIVWRFRADGADAGRGFGETLCEDGQQRQP